MTEKEAKFDALVELLQFAGDKYSESVSTPKKGLSAQDAGNVVAAWRDD